MRPRRRDRVAGEQDLQRDPGRDEPGQRRGPRGAAAHLHLADRERRVLGGHAQVTALGEQETAGPGDPVDGGDRRLGDVDVPAELGEEVQRRHRQSGIGHFLQVAAGAERLVPRAGQHQNPGAGVVVETPRSGEQAFPYGRVQRVAGLGPFDREPGDAVLHPVADRACHRATPSALATLHSGEPGPYSNTLVNRESLALLPEDAVDLDVTSLHHRRAVHRWERMSVGDLIERVTWSRPDKPAIVGRPGAYADERFAALTYRQGAQA